MVMIISIVKRQGVKYGYSFSTLHRDSAGFAHGWSMIGVEGRHLRKIKAGGQFLQYIVGDYWRWTK